MTPHLLLPQRGMDGVGGDGIFAPSLSLFVVYTYFFFQERGRQKTQTSTTKVLCVWGVSVIYVCLTFLCDDDDDE